MTDAGRAPIAWAEDAWGRRARHVSRLTGGWTSTILRLTADDGERAVLRLMTKEPWRTHAAELLAREAETQRQLANTAIPAPMSIAVDPTGARTGAPAHVMTWLPGSLRLTDAGGPVLRNLAGLLVDIHRHEPTGVRPRIYQSWAGPAKRVIPDWSARPALWRQAFAELAQPAPAYRGTFLHRDFHLGNVLPATALGR